MNQEINMKLIKGIKHFIIQKILIENNNWINLFFILKIK